MKKLHSYGKAQDKCGLRVDIGNLQKVSDGKGSSCALSWGKGGGWLLTLGEEG